MLHVSKKYERKRKKITYHLKLMADTGRPVPNISTTFIGKSKPLDE